MDIQRAEQILYNLANLNNKRAKKLLRKWQQADDRGKAQMVYEVMQLLPQAPYVPEMEYK